MISPCRSLAHFLLALVFSFFLLSWPITSLADSNIGEMVKVCDEEIEMIYKRNNVALRKQTVLYKDLLGFSELIGSLKENLNKAYVSKGLMPKGPLRGGAELQFIKCQVKLKNRILPEMWSKRVETLKKHLATNLPAAVRNELLLELGFITGQINNERSELPEDLMYYTLDRYADEFRDLMINWGFGASPRVIGYESHGRKTGYEKEIQSLVESARKRLENPECRDVLNQNAAVNLENTRDQTELSWCYAFSAADLLGHMYNKRLSAFSFMDQGSRSFLLSKYGYAESASTNVSDITNHGGSLPGALERARSGDFCLEESLKSEGLTFCGGKTYKQVIKQIYELKTRQQYLNDKCLQKNIKTIFPKVDFIEYLDDLEEPTSDGSNPIIEALTYDQCRDDDKDGEENLTTLRTSVEVGDPGENTFPSINRALDQGKLIGIDYRAQNIFNGNYGNGIHSSVIVGSRKNNGQCEYLVRNSWGKNCSLKKQPGQSCHQNCKSGTCKNSGHFWISETRLLPELLRIIFLTNENGGKESHEKY